MSLVLFHAPKSSASRRVRLFLEEKGLQYEKKEVDLSSQEQHKPEYLAINPLGVVPTILHNGRPLHESSTICEYIEAVYPNPPLLPADPYVLALLRNWVRHVDGLIGNLIKFNWRHHIQKKAEKMDDAALAEMLSRIPSAERREAWTRVARKPYTDEELAEARDKLVELLNQMEGMLSDGWLVGGTYSLADISVAPFVKRIDEEIAPDELTSPKHPRVTAWWGAVQARPAYQRADFGPFAA